MLSASRSLLSFNCAAVSKLRHGIHNGALSKLSAICQTSAASHLPKLNRPLAPGTSFRHSYFTSPTLNLDSVHQEVSIKDELHHEPQLNVDGHAVDNVGAVENDVSGVTGRQRRTKREANGMEMQQKFKSYSYSDYTTEASLRKDFRRLLEKEGIIFLEL